MMSVVHQSQNATSVVEKLAAIVPLYNEQATVTQLLTQLIAQEVISQVVIVDDGSTDNSVPLVKEWIDTLQPAVAERIQLVQHDINKGKGRAIRTGLEHVTCSHVIIQDADLEYDPADIKKLWAVMQSGEADVVYGSRYLENPKLQKGRWVMQSGVRFLNLLVRVLYGVKLTDEATCYKMFRTFDLRAMRLKCEGFEFCAEVSHFVARTDLQLTEVAISYRPRSVADGKKLRLRDGFHSLLIVLFGQVRFRPRYFLALALFLGGVCLVPYLTTSERGAADAKNAEVTKAVTKADAVTFDVGRIPAGTVVRHSFPISDATGAAYAPDAVRVNKSCGCTSAQVRTFADSRLYLDMLVNTDQKYGQFRERVSVELPGRSPG
ncbi:MAG: glycosyltransferase [Fuerstiella sp.]